MTLSRRLLLTNVAVISGLAIMVVAAIWVFGTMSLHMRDVLEEHDELFRLDSINIDVAEAIGLLATDGCLQAGVYQRGIEAAGLRAVLPTEAEIADAMTLIKTIKAGGHGPGTTAGMARLAAALVERGADAIIAGCTEIPLVIGDNDVSVPLVPSTDALAKKTVELATGKSPLPQAQ